MRNVPISTAAVFVHGLWLTGAESALLRRRIAASHGFHCHSFTYRTVGSSVQPVIQKLAEFVSRIDADRVHFVGHSLGGIVLHRYFVAAKDLPPGRVVFLGSPTVKSKTAERVGRLPVFRSMIGRMVTDELVQPTGAREWRCDRELGCIAGTRPMGLGRFFARFDEENDGTVAVSETMIPGLTDHLVLPHSHIGMLFAQDVAEQVAAFVRTGRFQRG